MEKEKYCLRYAAGAYWLLDTLQPAGDYKAPLQLNETGADIVKLLAHHYNREEIIRKLCEEYHADTEILTKDVDDFLQMLADRGYEIGSQKGTVRI